MAAQKFWTNRLDQMWALNAEDELTAIQLCLETFYRYSCILTMLDYQPLLRKGACTPRPAQESGRNQGYIFA